MKIKFNLHYYTNWGQQVEVSISFVTDDGRVKTEIQPMASRDSCNWTCTTITMESKQHRTVALYYVYQIVRGELIERYECNTQPRFVSVSDVNNYEFFDEWDDEPLQFRLDGISRLHVVPTEVKAPRLSISRRTIVFRVKAFGLQRGESIAILGNNAATGNWDVRRYLPMQNICGNIFQLTMNADVISGLPIAYKYVIVDTHAHSMTYWEAGKNRQTGNIEEIEDGKVIILNDTPVRIIRQKMYEAKI